MRLGMARRPISPKTSSTSVPNRHHDGGTIPLRRQSPQKRNPSLQSSRGLNQPSRWLSNFLTARIDDAAGFLMDVPPPAQGPAQTSLNVLTTSAIRCACSFKLSAAAADSSTNAEFCCVI